MSLLLIWQDARELPEKAISKLHKREWKSVVGGKGIERRGRDGEVVLSLETCPRNVRWREFYKPVAGRSSSSLALLC